MIIQGVYSTVQTKQFCFHFHFVLIFNFPSTSWAKLSPLFNEVVTRFHEIVYAQFMTMNVGKSPVLSLTSLSNPLQHTGINSHTFKALLLLMSFLVQGFLKILLPMKPNQMFFIITFPHSLLLAVALCQHLVSASLRISAHPPPHCSQLASGKKKKVPYTNGKH